MNTTNFKKVIALAMALSLALFQVVPAGLAANGPEDLLAQGVPTQPEAAVQGAQPAAPAVAAIVQPVDSVVFLSSESPLSAATPEVSGQYGPIGPITIPTDPPIESTAPPVRKNQPEPIGPIHMPTDPPIESTTPPTPRQEEGLVDPAGTISVDLPHPVLPEPEPVVTIVEERTEEEVFYPSEVRAFIDSLKEGLGDGFDVKVELQEDGSYLITITDKKTYEQTPTSGLKEMSFTYLREVIGWTQAVPPSPIYGDWRLSDRSLTATYYGVNGDIQVDAQLLFEAMMIPPPNSDVVITPEAAITRMSQIAVVHVDTYGSIHFTKNGKFNRAYRDTDGRVALEEYPSAVQTILDSLTESLGNGYLLQLTAVGEGANARYRIQFIDLNTSGDYSKLRMLNALVDADGNPKQMGAFYWGDGLGPMYVKWLYEGLKQIALDPWKALTEVKVLEYHHPGPMNPTPFQEMKIRYNNTDYRIYIDGGKTQIEPLTESGFRIITPKPDEPVFELARETGEASGYAEPTLLVVQNPASTQLPSNTNELLALLPSAQSEPQTSNVTLPMPPSTPSFEPLTNMVNQSGAAGQNGNQAIGGGITTSNEVIRTPEAASQSHAINTPASTWPSYASTEEVETAQAVLGSQVTHGRVDTINKHGVTVTYFYDRNGKVIGKHEVSASSDKWFETDRVGKFQEIKINIPIVGLPQEDVFKVLVEIALSLKVKVTDIQSVLYKDGEVCLATTCPAWQGKLDVVAKGKDGRNHRYIGTAAHYDDPGQEPYVVALEELKGNPPAVQAIIDKLDDTLSVSVQVKPFAEGYIIKADAKGLAIPGQFSGMTVTVSPEGLVEAVAANYWTGSRSTQSVDGMLLYEGLATISSDPLLALSQVKILSSDPSNGVLKVEYQRNPMTISRDQEQKVVVDIVPPKALTDSMNNLLKFLGSGYAVQTKYIQGTFPPKYTIDITVKAGAVLNGGQLKSLSFVASGDLKLDKSSLTTATYYNPDGADFVADAALLFDAMQYKLSRPNVAGAPSMIVPDMNVLFEVAMLQVLSVGTNPASASFRCRLDYRYQGRAFTASRNSNGKVVVTDYVQGPR